MTQEESQSKFAKSLKSFGCASANAKSPAVKVDELGGLELQFSIQAKKKAIGLEVYSNRGYDKAELWRCLPSAEWNPDGCDHPRLRRLARL